MRNFLASALPLALLGFVGNASLSLAQPPPELDPIPAGFDLLRTLPGTFFCPEYSGWSYGRAPAWRSGRHLWIRLVGRTGIAYQVAKIFAYRSHSLTLGDVTPCRS
jgi:hypothetical protein